MFITFFFCYYLAAKNESSEDMQTMADFCQQIPVTIEQLLHVNYLNKIRILKG